MLRDGTGERYGRKAVASRIIHSLRNRDYGRCGNSLIRGPENDERLPEGEMTQADLYHIGQAICVALMLFAIAKLLRN
jgi:hypothetical protein